MARLQELYKSEIAKALAAKCNHDNPLAIPKLTTIVINMGSRQGHPGQDSPASIPPAENPEQDPAARKPVITQGQSVGHPDSGFVKGNDIGLQGHPPRPPDVREFLDRLISIALPRIRDFRGVNPNTTSTAMATTQPGAGRAGRLSGDRRRQDAAFARHGHHDRDHSLHNDDQARELLRHFGLPFRQPAKESNLKPKSHCPLDRA